jgi:hypothetical protein
MTEVRHLQTSKAFILLMEDLREEYTERLIQAEVNSLTATTAHASMKVLADIEGRLRSYRHDGLFKGKR